MPQTNGLTRRKKIEQARRRPFGTNAYTERISPFSAPNRRIARQLLTEQGSLRIARRIKPSCESCHQRARHDAYPNRRRRHNGRVPAPKYRRRPAAPPQLFGQTPQDDPLQVGRRVGAQRSDSGTSPGRERVRSGCRCRCRCTAGMAAGHGEEVIAHGPQQSRYRRCRAEIDLCVAHHLLGRHEGRRPDRSHGGFSSSARTRPSSAMAAPGQSRAAWPRRPSRPAVRQRCSRA